MVGGAPITEEYAEKIGADGYAGDASQAVPLARRLLAG
jgi:5-methyltetrahydrofolate--homocysteine methyltransferase